MTGENPNNLKRYTWKLTYKEMQEATRLDRDIGFKKIPQNESQKAKYIIRVMSVLEKYGQQNSTQIKNKSGLSWNSVTRTLKLLESKKIIRTIQRDDKKNNEKIRYLDRKSAIKYYLSLLIWKNRDSEMFRIRKLSISKEMMDQIRSTIPDEELEFIGKTRLHEFKFDKNVEKKLIRAILQKRALLYYYAKGFYCRKCFLENHVVEVIRIDDLVTTCPRCGYEDLYNEEFSITRDESIRYRKNMIDHEVKKMLKSPSE